MAAVTILPSPLAEGPGVGSISQRLRQPTDPTPTPPLKARGIR